MQFVKMFIEQFTYWAPGINVIYLFRFVYLLNLKRDKLKL